MNRRHKQKASPASFYSACASIALVGASSSSTKLRKLFPSTSIWFAQTNPKKLSNNTNTNSNSNSNSNTSARLTRATTTTTTRVVQFSAQVRSWPEDVLEVAWRRAEAKAKAGQAVRRSAQLVGKRALFSTSTTSSSPVFFPSRVPISDNKKCSLTNHRALNRVWAPLETRTRTRTRRHKRKTQSWLARKHKWR